MTFQQELALGQAPAFWANLPLFGHKSTAQQAAARMQFGVSLVPVEPRLGWAGLRQWLTPKLCSGGVWVHADALVFKELGWSQGVGWALPDAGLLSLPVPWGLSQVMLVQWESCCHKPDVPLCATGQSENPGISDIAH